MDTSDSHETGQDLSLIREDANIIYTTGRFYSGQPISQQHPRLKMIVRSIEHGSVAKPDDLFRGR